MKEFLMERLFQKMNADMNSAGLCPEAIIFLQVLVNAGAHIIQVWILRAAVAQVFMQQKAER